MSVTIRAQASPKSRRNDGGQSIVEFAVIAPLLGLMLLGTIDLGYYMYQGIQVGNAARAGVAVAAQGPTTVASPIAGTATPGPNYQAIVTATQADANLQPTTSLHVLPDSYCACDSTYTTRLSSCTPATTSSCPAGDRVDLFASVEASGSFNLLVSFPGLPATITIDRTAIQQVSP